MASERSQRRIERLLDEADDAVTQLDWETVSARVTAILALDPDNAEAHTLLAAVERAIGGSSGAVHPSPETSFTVPTAAAPDQPTSFANGRYQVRRFLGEGGKKKVYLAQDTLLDREVAFALIKTEGLDEVSRTRITREAQAMGRLGSHPHIVTVFDLGEEDGQPFMVTELMGGGDVEGVIEDATDHRLPLEQAIDIAKETSRGLEFAHSRGIVHRDLKPGNVWLTEDGVAKIGDFGLAVAIDRSRLTTEGMMVGTVSYMPPEQAMGGAVTPKSDLYSLGAMLYEMVTGRPPFLGDDSVAIIGQHINTPPVAPTWHNSSCPRALEALILRLLAKDPSERPDSATDVLAALDGLDLTATAEVSVEEAQSLDSLAGGVFVGRQREMGDLKACLEDALSGRGRLVTLVGEPGIGKTRTAQELATYAGLRSAQVLWGRCYEEQGMPPFWPWVQAIRSYVRERDPEQLRSEMGAGAADIAEVVSDVKERLPDLKPPPQLDSPEQARFRLFDSIAAFLKSASQKQPLVLVLDDLHWADQPSLLLLQFVSRELGGTRVLLVGTYRDMELSRQHPLAETLGELTRERLFQRVLLRGLSQEDVGRFIEVATGTIPPQGLVQAVYTQTEGNPLFVTEVVRLLVQEGDLTRERTGDRDSWTVRIPEGVREVIGRRLNRLSQRCNETLTIASVIGREFTLDQMKPLVEDTTEDRLLEVLEEALSARVIEELPQAVGRYQFTHALIQETLTEELTLTRRVRLHAQIAQALEELYGDNAESHAAELAHHFERAESVLGAAKLVQYSLIAGERALASYAWEEGVGHFQLALAAKEGQDIDDQQAKALYGLGRAQAGTLPRNRFGEAISFLNRAFDYYADGGDISRALEVALYPVRLTNETGHPAGRRFERALTFVPDDSIASGRLLSFYAEQLGRFEGNYQGAQEAFGRALTIAQAQGDLNLEMQILAASASVDFFQMRYLESSEKSMRAVELARQLNDIHVEMNARLDSLRSLSALGDISRAEQQAADALALAERVGARSFLGAALRCNATLCRLTGDWQRGSELAERGITLEPQHSASLANAVMLHYEVGNFSEGSVFLDRLLEVMRTGGPGAALYGFPGWVLSWIAYITGETVRTETIERPAEAVLSSPTVEPLFALLATASLGLLAVVRGDFETAKEKYSALENHWTKMLPLEFFSYDRLLGLLARTTNNLDQSQNHFEDAEAFCRKSGYRLELAWTCCDYADTLLQRASTGSARTDDRQKAMTLLDEALAISSELGMRPLMERVLSRRDILKA